MRQVPATNDPVGSVSTGPSGRRRALAVVASALALPLLAGCSATAGARQSVKSSGSASRSDAAAVESVQAVEDTPLPTLPDLPVGINPIRLEIPSIGVDAPIVELDLRGAEPEVPSDFGDSGWYQQTRRPGEIGPSVIAGHVDSVNGPAVFAQLDELRSGDRIIVHGESGQTRTFVVRTTARYPKQELPPEVFNFDQPVPELRLITCGGTFDRASGHYRDNVVAYAELG